MEKYKKYMFTLNLSEGQFKQLTEALKKHRSFLEDDVLRYRIGGRKVPEGEERAFKDTKSLEKQIKSKTS